MNLKINVITAFLLLAACCVLSAQTRRVQGTVVFADDGEAVAGAYVKVDGYEIGVMTDVDGRFTLDNVPQDAKTVTTVFMGCKDSRMAIAGEMRIVMENDTELLTEAVVTGMQTMDRRLFTGSAAKLGGDDAKLSGVSDISRSLEGKVAGVSVQNVSGTFGTAPKIRVRGATSIYGSSKPLWVVDGVIMEDVMDVSGDELSSGNAATLISSAIAGLNSDDIESFDILKDGSATSIYGARAMAGVIVVTTKKGRAGQSHITYNGEYTMRLKPSYSNFNIMNSQEQMGVYQELYQKGYLNYASVSNASDSGVYGKMYELVRQYDESSGQFGLEFSPKAMAEYLRAAEYRNTDWFDILFHYSLQHSHSVSMSGGSDKSNYYASLSVLDDPGWTDQSSVRRYTTNMNLTYRLLDNLSLNMVGNASYRKQKAPGTLSSNLDAVTGEVTRDFDINPYSYALNTSRCLDPDEFYTRNYAPFNILHELKNNYIELDVTDFRIQGELKWSPWRHLDLSALGAVKHTGTSSKHNILDDSNQAQAYRAMGNSTIRANNPYLYTDPDDPYALPIVVLPEGGIMERTDRTMNGYDFRATASYNNVFAADHIVNLYGGTEINRIDRYASWFRGWGLQYSLGEIANYAWQMFKKSSEQNSQYYTVSNTHERSAAFFGNATYSYKGRYTINGTLRYEGTNKLGKSRSARWLPTWNISGGWNISDEPFMRGLYPTVSHLTAKLSYSLTADRGPSSVTNSYVVISSTTPWRPYSSDKESSLYISELANSDLTYEKKHELNFGLELGLLDNRINTTFDIYRRNNFDLIGLTTTEGVGGEIAKFGNIATMKSDGVELSVSTTNIKSGKFSWATNFIYSHSHNEVTDLRTQERVIDLVQGTGFAQEGYPVRSVFSIPFMGLNEEGLPTFRDQDGNVTVSDVYFQESDPDKLKFLEYSGTADPTDVGSLGNIFTWGPVKLNVFLTYSFGNVIRLDPVFSNTYSDLVSMPKEFKNRWVRAGDEAHTSVPVIASTMQNRNNTNLSVAYNAYNYSTARIAKGDFVRLKELSVSWDLPKSLTSRLKMSGMSVKLQGTNLCLLYADKKLNGQDPEFFNTGGVAVPMAKQFTFTLKMTM